MVNAVDDPGERDAACTRICDALPDDHSLDWVKDILHGGWMIFIDSENLHLLIGLHLVSLLRPSPTYSACSNMAFEMASAVGTDPEPDSTPHWPTVRHSWLSNMH